MLIGMAGTQPLDPLNNLSRIFDILGSSVAHIPFIPLALHVHARNALPKRVILIGSVFVALGWLLKNGSQVLTDITLRLLYKKTFLSMDSLVWSTVLTAVSLIALAVVTHQLRDRAFSRRSRNAAAAAIFLYVAMYLIGFILEIYGNVINFRGWYIVSGLHLPYIFPLIGVGMLLAKTPIAQVPDEGNTDSWKSN